jgi:ankyrin repeat protein
MNINEIHAFARLGNLDALRQSVEAGIDVNSKNTFGSTALHCAIAQKQVESVRMLLKLGADVTIQDANGSTPLHYAIEHKLPRVLETLLEISPEAISISDKHGNQPLWTAAFNARGNYEMVSLLLRYGADPKHLNNVNLSPTDIAKRIDDPALLQLLSDQQQLKYPPSDN